LLANITNEKTRRFYNPDFSRGLIRRHFCVGGKSVAWIFGMGVSGPVSF